MIRVQRAGVASLFVVLLGVSWAVLYGQPQPPQPPRGGARAPVAPRGAAQPPAAAQPQPAQAPARGPQPRGAAPAAISPARPEAEAEKAIRQAADAFVAAYNARDAKTIAAEFTPEAEFIDEAGRVISGRDAIEKHFQEAFKQLPEAKMKILVETVRVIAPNIAIEEGTTEATSAPQAAPEVSRYVALHVLKDGKWPIARARDFPAEGKQPTPRERLQPLAWLVGDWVDESNEALVHISCKWADGGSYLLQEFKAQFGRRLAASGTMRVGWDPLTRQIKSWTFESTGGFNEALWTGAGDEWTLKASGVSPDGRATSATTVIRRIDASTISWESHDRIVGGETADSLGPIIIKRRAPPPAQ